MVVLLNNDVSLTDSQYVCSENVIHPIGSQLAFGLGRRVNYIFVLGALVFALVLTVRVAQGSAAEPPLGQEPEAAAAVSGSTYIVQPGDTLWGVATELAPHEDPRPIVDQMVELNGSVAIAVGQEIRLPAGLVLNP